MITVTMYMHPDCPDCDQVKTFLGELQSEIPHRLVEVNIESDPVLWGSYHEVAPVVQIGPFKLQGQISLMDLKVALGAARDRQGHLNQVGDAQFQSKYQRGHSVTGTDRFTLWFSRHYMIVFNLVILIYLGLPFLAPVLMKMGQRLPATIIYKIYSPLCHQLGFRSWFLFGEQAYYPRAMAGIKDVLTFQQATGIPDQDAAQARAFEGNAQVGYKVAFCQRDVAIYGGILLFGLVFAVTGRRLKAVPWYIWVIIGIAPMGLDGVTQLPSLMFINLPAWIPLRESTPFLRTLTGGLFGILTAWYGYPLIEESMLESRRMLIRKLEVVKKLVSQPDDLPLSGMGD